MGDSPCERLPGRELACPVSIDLKLLHKLLAEALRAELKKKNIYPALLVCSLGRLDIMKHKIHRLPCVSWQVRLSEGFFIESVEVVVRKEIGNGWGRRAKSYVGIWDNF